MNEKLETISSDELKRRGRTPTCVSLFTGCGGAALGIAKAGFEIRVMVEWEKNACETLRWNWTMAGRKAMHEEHVRYFEKQNSKASRATAAKLKRRGMKSYIPHWFQKHREPAIMQVDITKTSTAEILKAADLKVGEAPLLEGGFPCQGFSLANNSRRFEDPRNRLYKECVRVIKEALPRMFFLENVPGLVSMNNGGVILRVTEDLAAAGYDVSWDILDAADYGVPQHRKRVFIIGRRKDAMVFPKKGNAQLHMGAAPGGRDFPKWYFARYAKKNKDVAALLKLSANSYQQGGERLSRFHTFL